jgi:eukaryotic-like serine/threonine-protein kinase
MPTDPRPTKPKAPPPKGTVSQARKVPEAGTQAGLNETIALPPTPAARKTAQPIRQQTGVGEQAATAGGPQKAASVLGDYKLLKKLGQGGMGAVYKAERATDGQTVAVKVLSKELAGKRDFVARFQREARVMAKLHHPNVLECYDVGEAHGYHYIAIEYVEGGSIESWLKKVGRFSMGDALHIVLACARALQHAHELSLIHRDVKPDNVLLTVAGVVKLADLGLAKDTEEDVSLTKSGAGAGTPLYMAPEQARNVKHVDARADIYALGCMLYVFLTGQPPFQGETLVELISAKEKGKYPPMRRHNDEVPSKLDLVVDKMLATKPELRYARCAEVIEALESFGLESRRLSFLAPAEEEEEAVAPLAPAAKITAKSAAPTKATAPAAEKAHPDVWYWKVPAKAGQPPVKRLSTDQLNTLIKSGSIDARAQVSKTHDKGYRALGTYTEFQGLFKGAAAVDKTKQKTVKDAIKDLAEADARRRRWKWLRNLGGGFGKLLMGLLWIALVLAVLGGGYYAVTTYLK